MDITTETTALFDNHPRLKNKELLLDITIVNPGAGSNLGNVARHVGKHVAGAVERMKNEIWGSFPATYSLLPLAISTCGEAGSDVHALIKELVIRRVQHIWTRLSRREVRASRRLYAEGGSCLRVCGAHGSYETAKVRDVWRNGGGRGLCGGPGKRVDGVFPGRPQSFRHQRRPVDDCSPG